MEKNGKRIEMLMEWLPGDGLKEGVGGERQERDEG